MLNKAVLDLGALSNVTQAHAQSIMSQTQQVDAAAAQPAAKAVSNEDSFVASLLGMAAPILGLISGGSALPIMNPLLSNFLPMLEKKFPQIVRKLWDEISKLLSQHSDSFLQALGSEAPTQKLREGKHFLSTLAGVVGQQPSIVLDSIRPHIDAITSKFQAGKYDVRFFGEHAGHVQENWITVDGKAEQGKNGADGPLEISAALYEKAYAQFRKISGNETDDPVIESLNAYFALTGKRAVLDDPTQMRTQTLLNILGRTNPIQGDAVMLGSRSSPEVLNADGLPSVHMFNVLGTYQEPTNNEWRVTLRDPWRAYEPSANNVGGQSDSAAGTPHNNGIFSVPLAQVQEDFEVITYPANSKLSIPQLGMH